MAPLEPELVETDAAALASAVLTAARHRCLVVLLTDLNPAALDEGLLPLLPLLAARHQVLVAAVADPRSPSWPPAAATPARCTTPPRPSRRRPSRRGSRRCCAARRRRGRRAAGPAAAALADAYLALKAAGRLLTAASRT